MCPVRWMKERERKGLKNQTRKNIHLRVLISTMLHKLNTGS